MTAVSLFVRPEAVYLLTDGAYYSPDGTVQHLASKVGIHEGLSLAFACSGMVEPAHIAQALKDRGPFDQEGFLALIPEAMRQIREENRRGNPAGEDGELNDLQLFVAMYSHERGRPEAWVCSSNQSYFGPRYQPFAMVSVIETSSPRTGLPFADPDTDALRIIEAQRAHYCADEGGYFVGGFAELTTVSAVGISERRLVTWPDRVGERIAA